MKTIINPKTSKKHSSMFNNMATHLKSKGAKCQIISDLIKSESEEFQHPTHIEGSLKNQNFRISISSELREDNGQPQVLLHLETEPTKFITTKPLTNGQLQFMIEQFVPGITTIETKLEEPTESTTTQSTKSDSKKPTK